MTTALEKNHDELAESPDFFQDNNVIKKKFFSRPYTIARINRQIFYQIFHTLVSIKKIFIIETLYLTKNLNPFSLDRKLNEQNKHETFYILWKECMLNNFYKYICTEENFLCLNGKACSIQK